MNSQQRVRAALRGEPVDRVPFSVYLHSKVQNRGVREFAEFTLAFHRRFRPDYVKAMYDENYDTPVNFQFATDPSVWGLLEELDPHRGGFGRQLESLKLIRDAAGPDTPVIQTLYSPFHWGVRLAWRTIVEHWELEPELVQRGLGVIARNVAAFGFRCAIEEAGIDGFMFAALRLRAGLAERGQLPSPCHAPRPRRPRRPASGRLAHAAHPRRAGLVLRPAQGTTMWTL